MSLLTADPQFVVVTIAALVALLALVRTLLGLGRDSGCAGCSCSTPLSGDQPAPLVTIGRNPGPGPAPRAVGKLASRTSATR